MTPRFVLWLVGQLPDGSAFSASVRGGPEHRPWTLQAHLMAFAGNMAYAANKQRAQKPVKKLPIQPPKPRSKRRGVRRVSIANLPSARRIAGR